MIFPTCHRLHRLLRNSSLLLLLLCLIAQPVLAAWGDMHELTAHSSSTGAGLDHDALHSDTGTDEGETDPSGDPLHALSHHAHCCSQPQLPFLSPLPIAVYALPSITPWPAKARAINASAFATPFRPPIQA